MEQKKDKYANDRFDREKYISKGFILPDGTMLTKSYARLHEDMAKKFVEENYFNAFSQDLITDPKDYMIFRLKALQVLSVGKPVLVFSDDYHNKIIQDAIASYLSFGWKQQVIENPYKSYFEYLRTHIIQNARFM